MIIKVLKTFITLFTNKYLFYFLMLFLFDNNVIGIIQLILIIFKPSPVGVFENTDPKP